MFYFDFEINTFLTDTKMKSTKQGRLVVEE